MRLEMAIGNYPPKLRWLSLLGICMLMIGCGGGAKSPSSFSRDTAAIEKLFPVLEADQVTALRYQDWCKVIRYQKGAYASSRQSTCAYLAGTDPKEFDSAAKADLERIWGDVKASKAGVILISEVRFDGSGRLVRAEFDCSEGFVRQRYVYDPGYSLPSDIPNERWHTAIDGDWYYIREDWN